MKTKTFLAAACSLTASASAAITFEELPFAAGDYENGANLPGSETIVNDPWADGSVPSQGSKSSSFTSGAGISGTFSNNHTNVYTEPDGAGDVAYDYWDGWAYSRTTDTVTSGFGNQYSSVAGGGASGSDNYAVAYGSVAIDLNSSTDFTGLGLMVTNTTYAHNSMRDGDFFGKMFGGVSGDDADWFLLTIQGWNGGLSTGTVEFYLADYRFTNNSLDYLVDEWAFVDLSALGTIDELGFSLSSSDNGAFGMNTPASFAIDNIGVVPEPSNVLLGAISVLGFTLRRSRRKPEFA